MIANHVLESAFRQLIHGHREFPERDTISVPVFVEPEGLNSSAGLGWLTLTKTEAGFIVEFTKERKQ